MYAVVFDVDKWFSEVTFNFIPLTVVFQQGIP